MRLAICAVLLVLVLLAAVPSESSMASPAVRPTKNITLYAHSDSSASSVGGRTLTIAEVSGKRDAGDVSKIVSFTLVPPLAASLHIFGSVAVNVWLQAARNVEGTLYVAVLELLADGTVAQIRSANVSASIRQARPSGGIFSFGGVDHILSKGSSIRLDLQFTPAAPTAVFLLWDHPATPTSLTIQVEDTISLAIQIIGQGERVSVVFPANGAGGTASLTAKVDVVDVFGSHDVREVTLSVTNSTEYFVLSEAQMVFTGEDPKAGSSIFKLGFTVPAGRYRTTVKAIDTANNSYTGHTEFTVTEFYPMTVVVSDLSQRPVRNAAVSILLNSTIVDRGETDDEGLVHLSAPSSLEVGVFSIVMDHKGAEVVLADRIDIRGHDMVRLEAPFSDWTIFVRYEIFGSPLAGASVRLDLGNATIASGTTGPDGSVTFEQMAAGNYTVSVEGPSIHYRVDARHSHDRLTMQINVPIALTIPTTTWLAILALAVTSTFGIYTVRRSRTRRPRSFRYFKTLLGGALPSSSIMMISGNPGSGKTQMTYSLVGERLADDRPSVFVTNVDFPARVRAALRQLGIETDKLEKKGNLRFVDSYTGLAGGQSTETHQVSSATDLTALGIQVSACLAEVDGKGDVYLDSITPAVVGAGFEKALEFVRYYGARVKADNCSFLYTVSSSIEPEALTKFEDEADCIIQLDLYESAGVTKRRMKIKKARGLGHYQEWIEFTINEHGEIRFLPGRLA